MQSNLYEVTTNQGLSVPDHDVLAEVWHHAAGTWKSDSLFIALIQRNSVLFSVLSVQGLDLSRLRGEETSPVLHNLLIATTVGSIAANHGHHLVNEVHLMRSLLMLDPKTCERQLAALAKQEVEAFQATRAQMDKLLKQIHGDHYDPRLMPPPEAAMFLFSIQRFTAVLDGYLSSPFFPFGEDDWNRYCREKDHLAFSKSDRTLDAFSSHTARNARLSLDQK